MTQPIPAKSWSPNRRPSNADTFLFIVHFDPEGLSTVQDNIAAWVSASALEFEILNMWDYGPAPLTLPSSVQLNHYAGVIIHPAVCYFPHNLESLDTAISPDFAAYSGVKVLAKQDEHYQSHAFARFITGKDFDVLVTCVPDGQLSKVYPTASLDGVEVVQQLTSYVSEAVRAMPSLSYEARGIDIGYRGSIQPLICGRLGYEKKQIGDVVDGPAQVAGLTTDISSNWNNRIHGSKWGKFLASCKSVLGVESGSNLFDFNGEVSAACATFTAQRPDLTPDTQAFYEAAHSDFLHRYEGNVDYGQLSPRHFEAAATGTMQILYEGRYSDILIPGRHYFPLKRDLSNLAHAFELISNAASWSEMTQAARREVIDSDRFTYAGFARRFDRAVEVALQSKPKPGRQSTRQNSPSSTQRVGNDNPDGFGHVVLSWFRRLAGRKNPH